MNIFKRLQAEQKLTELENRLEKLIQQKDKLDRDIESFDNTSDEKLVCIPEPFQSPSWGFGWVLTATPNSSATR